MNTLQAIQPLVCDSLFECFALVIDVIVMLSFFTVTLAIVYAGFHFVTAMGRPQKLAEARRGMMWVVIGSFVLLGSKALAIAIREIVLGM